MQKKPKIAITVAILVACLTSIYYFIGILHTSLVYTQFFYLPIILFSTWWLRKGIGLTAVISITLVIFSIILNQSIVENIIRASMFLVVGIATAILFERLTTTRKELLFQRDFNKSIVNSISDSLLVIDPKSYSIISANDQALKESGQSLDAIVSKPCHLVTHGCAKPCVAPHHCPLPDVITTEQTARTEHVHFDKDGQDINVEVTMYPIKNEKDEIIQVIHLSRNITDLKKLQLLLKQDNERILAMNEKLRAIGGLTRHDVRNKLSALNGNTYLLKKKYADFPDIAEGLTRMEQLVKQSSAIFDFARAYEQLGAEKFSEINVKKVVDEALAMISSLPFKFSNECQGLVVTADSSLRQLIYNLIDNTKKYGLKTTYARIYYKKDINGVQLFYEDDGVGITIENKSKLFTQGFSTGGSTGFGLFLIKKMIELYGWTITEEGEPGKGAKFVITIPIAKVIDD
jgi:signal transduction histidine kinase